MSGFPQILEMYDWNETSNKIQAKQPSDVERALKKDALDLDDFMALISPAAEGFLEVMAKRSRELTQQRFGKTLQLYAPLYLSNECQNICTYCGFSLDNPIPRKTLTDEEILAEAKVLKAMGYDHVLLVTGEANTTVGPTYFKNAIGLLRPYFSNISMEVQPLSQENYEELHALGVHSILVYQETYRKETYKIHHPKGKKSNFNYRLNTPNRIGEAGFHKIGLGALLGLEDWRTDSFFTALHLNYLEKQFWQTKYAISFPRLRPCSGVPNLKSNLSDVQLVQLICAWRIFNHEAELSLSTREAPKFRDHIIGLGITSLSAASKTEPGGYTASEALEQFEINDTRSVPEMVEVIKKSGYEVVWKDWDRSYDLAEQKTP